MNGSGNYKNQNQVLSSRQHNDTAFPQSDSATIAEVNINAQKMINQYKICFYVLCFQRQSIIIILLHVFSQAFSEYMLSYKKIKVNQEIGT